MHGIKVQCHTNFAIAMGSLYLAVLLISMAIVGVCYGENHYFVCGTKDCSNHTERECLTWHEYLANSSYYFSSDTVFSFLGGIHMADTPLDVTHTSNLVLSGEEGSTNTINCLENATLEFSNVSNVLLERLSITGCGSVSKPALLFESCTNVTLRYLVLSNSTGRGLVANNLSNNFGIANSTFEFNSQGNIISYSVNCTPHSELMIADTVFQYNNQTPSNENLYPPAGGLTVGMNCANVIGVMDKVRMFQNNGGNMAITFSTIPNTLDAQFEIKNSLFADGVAVAGGALYILVFTDPTPYRNRKGFIGLLHIKNCTFFNNTASYVGGAIYLKQLASLNDSAEKVTIENSIFEQCGAGHGGAAIHSVNYPIAQYLYFPARFQVQIRGCSFKNNFLFKSDWNNSGSGVVFTKFNSYFYISKTNITSNECSGIVAINSNLKFHGYVRISHNNAASGGGLLLCQNSAIYLTPATTIDIFQNSAVHAGGGICVESQCLQSKPPCFFQMSFATSVDPFAKLKDVHINVFNNSAVYAGNNLYGGSVDHCFLIYSPFRNVSRIKSTTMFKEVFKFENESTPSSITSSPRKVCLCRDERPKCDPQASKPSYYPGEEFKVSVTAIGQWNGTVQGAVRAKPLGSEKLGAAGQEVQRVTSSFHCQNLTYSVYPKLDTLPLNVTLSFGILFSEDMSVIQNLAGYQSFNFSLTLKECPIGFIHKKSKGCVCSKIFPKNVECNISAQNITSPPPQWIGLHSGRLVHDKHCPFDYCKTETVNISVNGTYIDQDEQCDHNRTGILCGACKDNLSTVLGTSNCRKCNDKYFALLMIFAILGLLLVVTLTMLNLTVAGGMLQGLFFYANVIQINSPALFPIQRSTRYTALLKIVISWLNLDFGIETCFYNGMDAYAKAWLQFAFPFYILFLSGAIVYLCSKSSFIAKIAGKNAVKVLATLILLAYAKILRAVIVSISFVYLDTTHINASATVVWLNDGNVAFLHGRHIPLFIFSIIVGLVCVPFTLSLLFIKQLRRYSHIKVFFCVRKLKPFFDAYTGVYNNNSQFWTGLLLLFRFILYTNYAVNITSDPKSNLTMGAGACLLAITIGWFVKHGLHKVWLLDILEATFLFNLGMLCLVGVQFPKSVTSASEVSVTISMVIFLAIFIGHLLRKILPVLCINLLTQRWSQSPSKEETTLPTPPVNYFDQEREPLLREV